MTYTPTFKDLLTEDQYERYLTVLQEKETQMIWEEFCKLPTSTLQEH